MGNKYCYYQLHMAMDQGILASLYTEPEDPESFIAGCVEALTPRHVLLWAVTPWGQADGWLVRRTEDVFQVFMGDDYEIRLQLLLKSYQHSFTPLLPQKVSENEDLLSIVLRHTMDKQMLITLQTAEDTFTGTVAEVDDLRVSVNVLDFFGDSESLRRFTLREIQWLSIDTQEEKMYERLRSERMLRLL